MSYWDALTSEVALGSQASLATNLVAYSVTTAPVANYFAAAYVPPATQVLSGVFYDVHMRATYTMYFKGFSGLLQLLAIALWAFAVWDRRNVRTAVMLLASFFGLVANIVATVMAINLRDSSRARTDLLVFSVVVAVGLPIISSLWQSTLLWKSLSANQVRAFRSFAIATVLGLMAGSYYAISTDLVPCGGYPCTARSRYLPISAPFAYTIFYLAVWLTIIFSHVRRAGKMGAGSKVNRVAWTTAFFGSLTLVVYVAYIVFWVTERDPIMLGLQNFISSFVLITEFLSDYAVRAETAVHTLRDRGSQSRMRSGSGGQHQRDVSRHTVGNDAPTAAGAAAATKEQQRRPTINDRTIPLLGTAAMNNESSTAAVPRAESQLSPPPASMAVATE